MTVWVLIVVTIVVAVKVAVVIIVAVVTAGCIASGRKNTSCDNSNCSCDRADSADKRLFRNASLTK